MNDGKIQQSGKPEAFYNRPHNIFVAKFIGSPTMNLIQGKMQNGKFVSDDDTIALTPRDEDLTFLKFYDNKSVTMGVRPERFVSGDKSPDKFDCVIDVVEMLGKEKILYAKTKSNKDLIISTPGHYEYNENEHHTFGFDLSAIHFFDTKTEIRIN